MLWLGLAFLLGALTAVGVIYGIILLAAFGSR